MSIYSRRPNRVKRESRTFKIAKPKPAPRARIVHNLKGASYAINAPLAGATRSGRAQMFRSARRSARAAGHRVVGQRVYRRDSQGRFA